MKHILYAITLVTGPALAADNFPAFRGQPVMDQANILTPLQEDNLNKKINSYEDRTSNEIAVVTVRSIGNNTIEDYANRMFRHYGIGQKDRDNGVLLLVSPQDHKVRIEVGYGLEEHLTDVESGRIISSIVPEFKQGHYDTGIMSAVDSIIQTTAASVQINPIEKFETLWGIFWFAIALILVIYANRNNIKKRGRIFETQRQTDLKREYDRLDRQRKAEQKALVDRNKMSESDRLAFLTHEENVRLENKRKARVDRLGAQEANERNSYSSSYSSPSDYSSSSYSDSGSSFSGGDSGGGGSSGDW